MSLNWAKAKARKDFALVNYAVKESQALKRKIFDLLYKVLGKKFAQGPKKEDFQKMKKHPQVFIQSTS